MAGSTRLEAITLSRDGNPEIYVMNLEGGSLQRLTNHGAIDTEPAWSPDGSSIVFTSDRAGKPQIYRMPASGGEPTRLPWKTTESQLAELFADHGHVERATISPQRKSGRSKGFGFVEMPKGQHERAIRALDGTTYEGRVLNVRTAR